MPVILEANYSKKIGLPGYSSHQYSITLRTEITDLAQVSAESQRLHGLLQGCVDRDIQHTGFLPSNGEANHPTGRPVKNSPDWRCSDKQRDLILKVIADHGLDKQEVEKLALDRFGKGGKAQNGKLERWHRTVKEQAIRPKTPLTLADARRLVAEFVERHNNVRLHSAIGCITPRDNLEGRAQLIWKTRGQRLKTAREKRRQKRAQASLPTGEACQ